MNEENNHLLVQRSFDTKGNYSKTVGTFESSLRPQNEEGRESQSIEVRFT